MFKGRFKGVSRQFQRCFNKVSRVFKESIKCVSRKFRKKLLHGSHRSYLSRRRACNWISVKFSVLAAEYCPILFKSLLKEFRLFRWFLWPLCLISGKDIRLCTTPIEGYVTNYDCIFNGKKKCTTRPPCVKVNRYMES